MHIDLFVCHLRKQLHALALIAKAATIYRLYEEVLIRLAVPSLDPIKPNMVMWYGKLFVLLIERKVISLALFVLDKPIKGSVIDWVKVLLIERLETKTAISHFGKGMLDWEHLL